MSRARLCKIAAWCIRDTTERTLRGIAEKFELIVRINHTVMKFLLRIMLLVVLASSAHWASGQIRKTVQKTEPKPQPKKVKKVYKEADTSATATPVADNTFTYLIIKANRGSAIKVTINDEEQGKIRAGGTKRYPLQNGEELNVVLDDEQGHDHQQYIVVSEADAKKNIVVAFPEIDYAAIEKAARDSMNAVIREERLAALAVIETQIKEMSEGLVTTKESIHNLVESVKTGMHEFDEEVTATYDRYLAERGNYLSKKKEYLDLAASYNLRSHGAEFLKEVQTAEESLVDRYGEYVRNVSQGKAPASNSLEIAVKNSRVSDLKFFVTDESINEKLYDGEKILVYAIRNSADSNLIAHLIGKGAQVNNFSKRLPDNNNIFATPLILACVVGNDGAVKALSSGGAGFYPEASFNKDRRNQLTFVKELLASKPELIESLVNKGYDMDAGTAELKAVIAEITANMVAVEGGDFMMGCGIGVPDCVDAEKPADTVTVSSFSISKYEITKKQWKAVMEEDAEPATLANCNDCPVSSVTFDMVQAFIKKLNEYSGMNFRLPSEAEWEYAAKGGQSAADGFKFSGSNTIHEVAWYRGNSPGSVSPVGRKSPNQLGLFDMSGNVNEWCEDWFLEGYYKFRVGTTSAGPESGSKKVVRGGSIGQSDWSARITQRSGFPTYFVSNEIGFRLAL